MVAFSSARQQSAKATVVGAPVLGTKTLTMKVLHVLHHSVPDPLDGYAIRSHAILRAQQSAGVNVCAVTGSLKTDYASEDVIDGVRYLRTPGSRRASIFGYEQFGRYLDLRKRLQRAAAQEHPDLIHAHSPVYNGLAALAIAREQRIPLVYELRALWEDAAADQRKLGIGSFLYRLSGALESYLLKRADSVVTLCYGLKDLVATRGVDPNKMFIAPNGVNTSELGPLPRDRELAASLGLTDGFVIGFIGSLFSFEGVEDLLDVVPAVLEACPKVSFLIVGGGEREAMVAQRSQELSRGGRFIYQAAVPHDQVRRYYSLLDCLVYPRRSTRLTQYVTPLKPLEAMAMEKTVVASDIGGHRELIRDGETGVLYQAGNPSSLVRALCKIAGETTLRASLAAAGRKYVLDERQWEHVTQNHLAAYETALRRRGRYALLQ